jgi:hypothetical protein
MDWPIIDRDWRNLRFHRQPSQRQQRLESDWALVSNEIRGLEQNPETKLRWAQLARTGKKEMQFLSEGRYVANVADGKVTVYAS